MGILDKITGKKEESKKRISKKKDENVLDMVKEESKSAAKPVQLKEDTKRAHSILLTYHLSEKTNQFSSIGRYVFKVATTANKIEVKKAVESVYDVHVIRVNMINTRGKSRRYGRIQGMTSKWKKAIVTLKSGEKIAGLAEGV